MLICNHHIKDSEIVGIGPLMVKQSSSINENTLYNPRQLFFYLHLRNISILIESDKFYLAGLEESEITKNREALRKFETSYHEAKDEILLLIAE